MNNFLENRPVIGRNDVNMVASQPQTGFQAMFAAKTEVEIEPAAEAETTPMIELVRNAGKVDRIIVTCTCCNRIELQCQY
jgi:hypothetical protein